MRSLTGPAGGPTLSETLPDVAASSSEGNLLRCEAEALLAQALERLEPQERRVLEQRYGLAQGPGLVLGEVGLRMRVSRERVRQIEVQAMRRLRRWLEPSLAARACDARRPAERRGPVAESTRPG